MSVWRSRSLVGDAERSVLAFHLPGRGHEIDLCLSMT